MSNLAQLVFDTKVSLDNFTALYKEKCAELIGVGPNDYLVRGGKVNVTEATSDRASGQFNLIFDQNAFLALPKDQQQDLEALGLVRYEPKVTSGRPSMVRVTVDK